jgi:hypothetical protein
MNIFSDKSDLSSDIIFVKLVLENLTVLSKTNMIGWKYSEFGTPCHIFHTKMMKH